MEHRVHTTVGDIWVADNTVFDGRDQVELLELASMIERGLDFSATNPDFDPFLPETLDPKSAAAVHLIAMAEVNGRLSTH